MRIKQEVDEEEFHIWARKLADEGKRLEGELAVVIDELNGLILILLSREHKGSDEIDIDCSGVRRALLGVW